MRLKTLVTLLLLTACNSAAEVQDDGRSNAIIEPALFIVQNTQPDAVMEALFTGRVIMDQSNCLRLGNREGATVVWPKGFSLVGSQVFDADGDLVGQIGGHFKFGGGEVPNINILGNVASELRASAASRCPGRFWIVGDVPKS